MKDDTFIRGKVPMTKEEVRTVSLSKLQLSDAKTFLDIGAGTGSVSLEAALTYPQLSVTAIEQNLAAVALIEQNKQKFQLEKFDIITGKAPLDLPKTFERIFIGGSGGNLREILAWCTDHLQKEGRLVLNFILSENALEAENWLEKHDWEVESIHLQVSKRVKLGKGHYYQPQNPVVIISAQKRKEA